MGGRLNFGTSRSVAVSPNTSGVFTILDSAAPLVGRNPLIVPHATKPTPVPGTGTPIVSNNPIQSSSPFFSALQSPSGVSPDVSADSENAAKKWKIAIGVLVAIFLAYIIYREF